MRRRITAVAAALACAAVAGCGGTSGDILGLGMSGGPAKQTDHMHVTEDGRGSCNKNALHTLSSATVIKARSLVRDAKDLAKQGADFGQPAPGLRNFELRTPDGTVTWVENAPQLPLVLSNAELLTLELARQLC
jgi:hypothetical protein